MSGLDILQHSLGVDQHGQGRQYRNYFCTGPGSTDYDQCVALVGEGLMTMRKHPLGAAADDMDLFHVTEAGKAYVAEHSPPPPKLSRAQQRYRQYLDADTCMSFGEWLKAQARRTQHEREFADDLAW